MPRKKKDNKKPRVNPELQGFDIYVNSFGEIVSNYDIDQINAFLNRNVKDKKLKNLPISSKTESQEAPPSTTE
ncbi:MAG: hypothetical protein NZ551_06885 [Microscillaceae bacterium]|nr:hypothetical protein [Microscillaceae bacterium]MDW8460919.1 hypothetical protein [Cytophagales bacterium]